MIHIPRLCVIGVGLIGGSLALALRRAGIVGEIVGCGRNQSNLRRAVELGVVDCYQTNPASAVTGADMIVLGVPLGNVRPVLTTIRDALDSATIITDVGSAKRCVIEDIEAVFGDIPARFVPGHPVAGTEKSGVEAAFADLFQKRRTILTPLAQTDPQAVSAVAALWEAVGAEVISMSADHHDRMLAATSHLPHLLAFGLVDTLARWGGDEDIFQYAAGGFRDFTRIASSDPVMWRDICIANRAALLEALEHYREDLGVLTELVRCLDGQALERVFRNAKAVRDRYLPLLER
ncbi:prephenate dehydrogenase [Nitrococcus mobilis]|uniref:prephenate dehydrogenase n=1 Tax=Nitrococcus mobilis Nb-231 TaxID=314278 RepID=A4BM52_9GAMM|nr:prephenate dehydrogenase/arogenate dehydrogenase family protein [Nitrococcus mobilis]EAR23390.1 Prephenate dehydrogenase [Nitrococcus mobilis Nb-231]